VPIIGVLTPETQMRKLAHLEIPRPSPAELSELSRHPIRVILNNIRSVYNVGSIFRTADAARIEHIYVTGYTATPDHRSVHKTALGAQDMVPWSYVKEPFEAIHACRADNFIIAALEITDTPTDTRQLTVEHFPLCMIVGNEVSGVDDTLVDRSDLALEIPQFGAKQSLNASVAFGIAIFDAVRTYRTLTPLF